MRLLILILTFLSAGTVFAEKTVADLSGEDRVRYDQFRHLFKDGSPTEFYKYVEDYQKELRDKGYMMLYYKLLSNKGFYALRHNQIHQAIEFAQFLDSEVRDDDAKDYFYLATGLFGDIYSTSHDKIKAEAYFLQSLEQVGDRDDKFTMRTYLNLSDMLSLKEPNRALEWAGKAITMAEDTKNMDYLSMALGMKGYILFLLGDTSQFFQVYNQYVNYRTMDDPEFNFRFDNFMETAKLAFDHEYRKALEMVGRGDIAVDSSLVVIRIHAMSGNVSEGFHTMMNRYVELDSIFSILQELNFNQMASETTLTHSREEAIANKRLAKKLAYWLIGLTAVYIFVYIMGRRRLMRKIWARNKDLKLAKEHAEASDRMKTAFIQNMSHEIRTPLNAVSGFSQILCNPDYHLSDEEKKDMQQRIRTNVDIITSTVNELLELSNSESEGEDVHIEKTDVKCNELCLSLIEARKYKGNPLVEIRFSSNVDDNFTVSANAYRLRSALGHLLDNAQKFTEIGHIDLMVEEKDCNVYFVVSDTGVGIDPKERERIFETFSKLDSFKEGIGLGLPLCRKLVTSMGGRVELDPLYTGGSRFVITLPKA